MELARKIALRLCTVAATVVVATTAVAIPASAGDPNEPMRRCNAGGVSTDTHVTLAANPGWLNALDGQIWQYDAIRIVATGLVRPGPWPFYAENGPNGINETAPPGDKWIMPGAPKFSLVGFFHNRSASLRVLGANSGCFRSDGTGLTGLTLWMNDEAFHDNYGQFTITIKQYYYFP